MANILYIGNSYSGSTSLHRANALKRIGHALDIKDPEKALSKYNKRLEPLHFRTGYTFLQKKLAKWVTDFKLAFDRPDAVWVDSGELLGVHCLQILKRYHCPVILYNVDDPTGKRDGNRFNSLLKALQLYDLVVVVRKETETECRNLGAQNVMRVFRSYDEEAHRPFDHLQDIPVKFISDVAFIGTWMRYEKRDEFLLQLIKNGIPVSIWGDRWQKSPHWKELQLYYRGRALSGRDYVAAIQGAKICLGFLSKGNRDLHTQRSLEVPFAGGLICAERTVEHQELYIEKKEAFFWSDAAECERICKELLEDDQLRETVRLAGMQKVRTLKVGNEDICRKILLHLNIS